MKNVLLETKDLKICFKSDAGLVHAVDGIDLTINKGEVLGLVGESGSGKSVTSLGIMRLVPKPNGYIDGGEILFEGEDLLKKSEKEIRNIRGNKIAMIFQEPMSSLNPVLRIGFQLGETLKLHQNLTGAANREKCIEMLKMVRIPDPEKMMERYPHELSGGMRQRVMIAMAILCNPRLMIADEPTTALDVTIQAQILQLLKDLKDKTGMSILFITHDLGVIAEIADRVAVMYTGKIVEEADVKTIIEQPLHPYTKGLIEAIPENYDEEKGFKSIPGMQPSPINLGDNCRFFPRCRYACEECMKKIPDLVEVKEGHRVRCVMFREGVK